MWVVVTRRVLAAIPILFIVSIVVFGLLMLVPGDAATTIAGGPAAPRGRVEEVRAALHLDDPFLVQYGRWLWNALQLDFGTSVLTGESVSEEIRSRLPVTMNLAFGSIVYGVVVGGVAGAIAGMRNGSRTDRLVMLGTTLGIAVPSFVLAIVLLLVFAVELAWLPALGFTSFNDSPWDWLRSMALPCIALGTIVAAGVARQVRGEMADVMERAYIRTAWANGASLTRVVGKHALKNASTPAVTLVGLSLGGLLSGTVLTEQIFSIPGLGSYLLGALAGPDMPVIMGVTTVFVLIHVTVSLVVDIAYTILNPKVRPA